MVPFNPLAWFRGSGTRAKCRTALSCCTSLEEATKDVTNQLGSEKADLALFFVSSHFASDLPRLHSLLCKRLQSKHWIGFVAGGVVGTDSSGQSQELEQTTALSITFLNLPGARLNPFQLNTENLPDLDGPLQHWQNWVDIDPADTRSLLLFIDPSCGVINDLISGLDYAYPNAAILGGIAAPHNATHGSLLIDGHVINGAVGMSIGGDWFLDPVIAQGCRPIGPVFAIEQAQRNVLLELSDGNRRDTPVACLQRVLADLNAEDRELVQHSLFLGVERRNLMQECPSDFLVRNLIGVDPRNGAVAVAERVRPGQHVQFQLREAQSSRLEARQLLEASKKRSPLSPPLCGLLFACLGRGSGLFGEANGDISIARDVLPNLPIAGAFCNGEIGPLSNNTYLHGYTACWGLLRHEPLPESSDD